MKQQIIQSSSMSTALLLVAAALLHVASSVDARPVNQNQNQVRFRRLPPKEFSALLGSSITIECEAGASPSPAIHWLKNGKRIQQTQLDENLLDDGLPGQSAAPVDDINRIALSSTRSRLFIDCADTEDEATYTCVAENAFSRIASNTKLNLIRPLAASAVQQQQQQQQPSGAAGNGLAVAGSESSDPLLLQDTDGLSAMPQCLSQRNSRPAEPARIHMWTHNIVEIMKNDVVLYCRSNVARQSRISARQQELAAALASADAQRLSDILLSNKVTEKKESAQQQPAMTDTQQSRASVSWTLPDEKSVVVSSSSQQEQKDTTTTTTTTTTTAKYEILDSGDLLIRDLRWEDMGSYVCTVSNELGSDSVSTFVYPASVKSAKSKRATLSQAAFKSSV